MLKTINTICAAGLTLLVAACAANPQLRDYPVPKQAAELSELPFLPENEAQGAPAALATVLAATDLQVTPEALKEQVYDAATNSSAREAVLAATRRNGRIAYVLQSPTIDLDAVKEVQAGHPVLVLLRLGTLRREWRYAVMVGVDPAANQFILRMGLEKRALMSYGELLRAWAGSEYWAMLAVKPSTDPASLPVTAQVDSWIAAAEPFAALGQAEVGVQADLAATQRWPQEIKAWTALGKVRQLGGDSSGAIHAYATAAKLAPDKAELHVHLAEALHDRQCFEQAADEINKAVSLETDPVRQAGDQQAAHDYQWSAGPSAYCQLD